MYDENIGIMPMTEFGFDSNRKLFFCTTTDGGKTWKYNKWPEYNGSIISISVKDLRYINKNLYSSFGYLKLDDGEYHRYLIYVHNNWESWDTVRAPLYSTYLTFGDENNVWTAGNHDELDSAGWSRYRQYIYHSSDGGHTWQTQWNAIYEGGTLKDIEFYDNEFGVAGGMDALTLITDDGGRTWDINLIKDTPPDGSAKIVNNIEIPDRNTVYVVYNFRRIYKLKRNTTSVAEQSQSPEVILTPNPAGDYIEIIASSLAPWERARVRVYNLLGNVVIDTPPGPLLIEGERIRLDVSGLAAGVYFVRVGDKMYKFVKM
jgi:hypothetical protein